MICRCRFFSELFHPVISLNATPIPCAVISLSVTWVFKMLRLCCLFPRAVLTSPSSYFWSLCPFLNSLLKFTSIQGPLNGGFIQIGQYLTYFLPSSSCRLTFPLYIFAKGKFHPPATETRGEVLLLAPSTDCFKSKACISHSRAKCQRLQEQPGS